MVLGTPVVAMESVLGTWFRAGDTLVAVGWQCWGHGPVPVQGHRGWPWDAPWGPIWWLMASGRWLYPGVRPRRVTVAMGGDSGWWPVAISCH